MDIRALLSTVNGSTFMSISTATTPILAGGQKNPHQGRVRKITQGTNVMVFQNKDKNGYNEMVKRRLIQEGKDPESFQLSPRRWGQRVPNLPLVEHNGQLYLEVIRLRVGDIHYELDGMIIAKQHIQGLKPDPDGAEQGGLNKKVDIHAYNLSSLTELTINKTRYDMRGLF